MRTKLEAVAAYLAGRGSDDDAQIQADLDDPSSELSRFLASTRARSKALLENPVTAPQPQVRPRPRWPWAAATVVGLASLAGLGWLVEARFHRLEADVQQARSESTALAHRLLDAIEASKPAPPPASTEDPLKAIEARLDRLIVRPTPNIAAPPPPPAGSNVPDLRAELEAIRREVLASERASARQVQELRSLIQELGQSIRRASGLTPAQLQALVANLSSPTAQARLDAIDQITRLGHDARAAIPAIRQMIARETDTRVRAAAEAAIEVLRAD